MEKIIDYVNETPYNTNIGILKDKLRKYSNELTSDVVKFVNGNKPDENGNIDISYKDLVTPPDFNIWDELCPIKDVSLIGEWNGIELEYEEGMGSLTQLEWPFARLIEVDKVYDVTIDGVCYSNLVAKTLEMDGPIPIFLGNSLVNNTWVENEPPFALVQISIEGEAVSNIMLKNEVSTCDLKIEVHEEIREVVPYECLPLMPLFVHIIDKEDYDADGNDCSTLTISHTFNEILEALMIGRAVDVVINIIPFMEFSESTASRDINYCDFICIRSNYIQAIVPDSTTEVAERILIDLIDRQGYILDINTGLFREVG